MIFLLSALLLAAPPAAAGELVDVNRVIPDAVLDIRYATSDNFLGRKVYPVARCLLRAPVAARLKTAADRLRPKGFRLRLYDCYRPRAVQWEMWKIYPRRGFVADPRKGSNHNRGGAVDLSLATADGKEVEMPTSFDAFDARAAAYAEAGISPGAKANRLTLRGAMEAAGFKVNRSEWWHFDDVDSRRYRLLDVPLDAVP